MGTHRMFPPGYKPAATAVVQNRTYTAALGSYVTCPVEMDANELDANDWVRAAPNGAGTTAQRPASMNAALGAPMYYLDTTLGYIIVWDGITWRNPNTGASV